MRISVPFLAPAALPLTKAPTVPILVQAVGCLETEISLSSPRWSKPVFSVLHSLPCVLLTCFIARWKSPLYSTFVPLRYKPENHEFDSSWGRWDFSLTWPFRLQYGPGVDSTSSRNEYQEYVLATLSVWLTTLPPSCAEWLEILGASNCCISKALSRPVIASYPRVKKCLTIGKWG